VEERARLAAVLHGLQALGVRDLFLEGLSAREALGLAAGVGVAPLAGRRDLESLAAEAAGCQKCRLATGRTQVVFGRGNGQAELVVVGEAPGAEEDRRGQPFVGPAGKLLDLLLLAVGFGREAVYICNVLKCRPPNNRDPRPDEVAQCAAYLHAQLEAIAPRALLAVGKFSAQTLAGSEESIGRLRGRVHSFRGIPVVATYHPAYLLRSPHATRKTWQDLQLLKQVLDERS
jgi:uracil-DNA glycosylase